MDVQPNCVHDALPQFEARLERKYGETLKHVGITNGGDLLRLYVSDASGTWTILVVLPNNLVCMFGAGDGWQKAASGPQS